MTGRVNICRMSRPVEAVAAMSPKGEALLDTGIGWRLREYAPSAGASAVGRGEAGGPRLARADARLPCY